MPAACGLQGCSHKVHAAIGAGEYMGHGEGGFAKRPAELDLGI